MEKHDNTSAFASEWDDGKLHAAYELAKDALAEAQANVARLAWIKASRLADIQNKLEE